MKTLPLSQGKHALVDDTDYQKVKDFKWSATKGNGTWYAYRKPNNKRDGKSILLHRFLMGDPKGRQIDHRDRNGLNNTRDNLRIATQAQNNANSICRSISGFKGVYFHKKYKKKPWGAAISVRKKQYWIAFCAEKEDAAIYYNTAAQLFFGDFARLNVV